MNRWIAVGTVVCAALVAQAAPAEASHTYTGPIDLQPRPFPEGAGEGAPTVQLKVRFQGKQPIRVDKFLETSAYFFCSAGPPMASYPTDTGGHPSKVVYQWSVKVNKRRFAASSSDAGQTVTITGRIPAKGAATGTVRIVDHLPLTEDPELPAGTCDTGTLNWRATRSS